MTSKEMNDSQKSSKKKKEDIKEVKEENARFSKVRRMLNKDKQRQEFE